MAITSLNMTVIINPLIERLRLSCCLSKSSCILLTGDLTEWHLRSFRGKCARQMVMKGKVGVAMLMSETFGFKEIDTSGQNYVV